MKQNYISTEILESLSARNSLSKESPVRIYCIVGVSILLMIVCSIVTCCFIMSNQNDSNTLLSRCTKISSLLSTIETDRTLAIHCHVNPLRCTEQNKSSLIQSHTAIYNSVRLIAPKSAARLREVCLVPIEKMIPANISQSLSSRLSILSRISSECSKFLDQTLAISTRNFVIESNQHAEVSKQTVLISMTFFYGLLAYVIRIIIWVIHSTTTVMDSNISKHQEHMRRMLRSWNHDNKNVAGALLSSLEELEQSVSQCNNPGLDLSLQQCQALSSHLAHSVSVMSIRHAIASGTTNQLSSHRQPVNLHSIVSDILRIPGFEDFVPQSDNPLMQRLHHL